MLYEDLRGIHEDVERLEQAIAERNLENPRKVSHGTQLDSQIGDLHLTESKEACARP